MISIEKLKQDNASVIVSWCNNKDEDFLRQWAGRGYIYPLTEKQILDRVADGAEIFEALRDGKMVGTIEIISRNDSEKEANIGRFVLDQAIVGSGIGTEVLQTFLDYCKEELGILRVTLSVFDFNARAYKCYQKCGFMEAGCVVRPNGWKAINMEKVLG